MRFYVLRHAIAISRIDPACPAEADRFLTDTGRAKMEKIGQAMRKLKINVPKIYTSPWTRAYDTAVIAAKYLNSEVISTDELTPYGDIESLINQINTDNPEKQDVMICGHEPSLSFTISMLLTGSNGVSIDLKKAGLCAMDIYNLKYGNCADLLWLLKPSQLVKMA